MKLIASCRREVVDAYLRDRAEEDCYACVSTLSLPTTITATQGPYNKCLNRVLVALLLVLLQA